MPAAMVPFTPETTRLKLSNVPKPPRRTAPPFGASGLTYSKRLKPAGYFSCPNSESAWRHSFSSACAALLRASGPIVGATSAAALLRKRVRRESFTDWLPNRRTRPRVSLNYGRFQGRQQRSVLRWRDPAMCEPRKSSHGERSRRKSLFLLPRRRFGRLRCSRVRCTRVGRLCGIPRIGCGLWCAARICGFGQRLRVVRLRIEVRDHVGALAPARQSGEAHLGAGNVFLGACEEFVEVVERPVSTLLLHRIRIGEPAFSTLGAAHHAIEVRADAVRLALAEGVACGAFLRRALALAHIGAGQELCDGLVGFGLGGPAATGWMLRHRDLKPGLCGLHRMKHCLRADIEREQAQAGEQKRTQDLVDFER